MMTYRPKLARACAVSALVLLACCASTPNGKIVQAASTVTAVNDGAVIALDYELISVDQAKEVQRFTRLAANEIRRAAAAVKAGEPRSVVDGILATAKDYLNQANAIVEGK